MSVFTLGFLKALIQMYYTGQPLELDGMYTIASEGVDQERLDCTTLIRGTQEDLLEDIQYAF